MRLLPFISCLSLLACSSPYKKLYGVSGDPACIQQLKPVFPSVLYKTNVSVVGKQFSGLLLVKTTQDSSIHLVFTSETGITFFNFEFSQTGGFKVHYILKQMDRKAVIKTLRKDFEMVLWKNTDMGHGRVYADSLYRYNAFPQESGTNYYITDSSCHQLVRIERGSSTKVVAEARMNHPADGVPDSITIRHRNFNFSIVLTKIRN